MNPLLPTLLQRGQFLIASPDVEMSLLSRTVLLLCEHNESGSFGIVVNKSLDIELPEEILNLKSAINKNISLRAGGPVQTNQMMLLHTTQDPEQQLLAIADGIFLGGNVQFLHKLLHDESSPPVHLCFGYAGWTSGQLEREFLDGSWFPYPATKMHLFETAPEQLWKLLLREMGGKYATLSTIPEDLSMN